jgi:D-alanyl-D-alanine carboxypeptidase/D-alanyl-D-alanine-endopeptidase (penicillin-binding protein 4)
VRTADGEQWVFSMVTNNSIGVDLKALEDRVTVRLAQDGGPTSTARTAIPAQSPDVSELECSWVKAC